MELENLEKQWLLEEKYKGVENSEFFEDLKKLELGTPLAYLIGNVPFLGLIIDLKYRPLIPRPETEYWVDYCIKKYIPENTPVSTLDIFSGSGCIGLAIAKNRQYSHILCADIKKENIDQIKKNILLNSIPETQVKVFESNIFENIPKQKFDFIFANPPYISKERKETVQDSVLEYEDHLALFAEDDGLFFIKKCIENTSEFLQENGYMFIEFDPWQKELLENYIQTKNLYYEFLCDQYQKNRILILQNKKLT